jgi:hypothetical protein
MRFSRRCLSFAVIVFKIALSCTVLANDDFGQTEKQDAELGLKVEYLGSVLLDSSLTSLVGEGDRQTIGLKEKWLDSEANLGRRWVLRVSENGRYKVVATASDQKSEGVVKATFVDSNGAEIWSADVGYVIYISNNGRNIVAASPLGHWASFYDVRTSTEPLTTAQVDAKYTFSYDGDHFISAGSKLTLREADGTVIWEKGTGTEAYKKVAISADGSRIVMASSGEPEPSMTEVPEGEEEKPEDSFPPKSVVDERLDGLEPVRERTAEEAKDKPSEKAGPHWSEKKVYLSFLRGDGTLINQTTTRLRIAQNLAISLDGRHVALSCDSTLLFYETETGVLLWRRTYPTVYWWMKDMALSSDGSLIALGVRPDRGDRNSPPYLCLVSKDNSEIANFNLEELPPGKEPLPSLHYHWGPILAFTDDDRYIIVATSTKKYLFGIVEASR